MKRGKKAYPLRIPDEIVSLVRGLHPLIRSHLRLALQAIIEDPLCGKALKEDLHGLRSYRVKRYRIIYRFAHEPRELEIIAIGPRRNIYEETFKIISKEEKKKLV
jgi:mRNA interferase RelE/StbE